MNISTIKGRLQLVLLLAIGLCCTATADAQIITTVAGSDSMGYAGDGGAATMARLRRPYGTCFDKHGNMFIADYYNNVLRKVSTGGIITTVAGTGIAGFSGNGGPATDAQLGRISGVAVDAMDNIIFSDLSNNIVWQVSSGGTIYALAGNGAVGYSGDGGMAYAAQLSRPNDVGVDAAGNIYIADQANFRIRKIATTGIISTIAGIGTNGASGDGGAATNAQIGGLNKLTFDAAGNIYFTNGKTIRKINTAGIISTIGGGGTTTTITDGMMATAAGFDFINGITVDNNGTLFVSLTNWGQVYKIDAIGLVSLVANTAKIAGFTGDGGPALNAKLASPNGLSVDGNGDLYIADASNNRIRKITMAPAKVVLPSGSVAVMNVWPNPSGGDFSVNISSAVQGRKAKLVITNVLGQVVGVINVNTNEDAQLHLELPSGQYKLSAEIAGEKLTKSFIIR